VHGDETPVPVLAKNQTRAGRLWNAWMQAERGKLSRHSDVAKTMDYMLKRWDAFNLMITWVNPPPWCGGPIARNLPGYAALVSDTFESLRR
jgi:hypothetical protein